MPSNKNEITLTNDQQLARIIQLEQENEALKLKLNEAISAPSSESSSHHHNIFAFLEQTSQIAHVGGWEIDLVNNKVYWTKVTRLIHEVEEPYEPTIESAISYYKEGTSRDTITNVVNNALKNGAPFDVELQIITAKSNERWVRAKGRAEFFKETPIRIVGTFQDINEEKNKENVFLQMQETLQQSEQQYKSLFNQNPAGVFSLNIEGYFTSINDAMAESMGFAKEYILNIPFWKLVKEFQKEEIAAKVAAALLGEAQKGEMEVETASGNTIIISLILLPIVVNNSITGLFGIATDITAGRKVKQALMASEDNLRAIFESTGIGHIMMDMELTILSFNTTAANFTLSVHKKELEVHSHFLSYFSIESHDEIMNKMSLVLKGEKINYEKQFFHDFGDHQWFNIKFDPVVNEQGLIFGILMTIEDITTQRLANEVIKTERNQLRTLIDNIPDAIYIKDSNARKIITNKVDLRLIGSLSEDAILGKTDLELFDGIVGEIGYADDMLIITTGVAVVNKEQDFVDREGNKQWLLTTKVPIRNEQHKITGLLGIGRIITQQKNDQAAIKKSNERFEYVTKATFDAIWDWDISTNELYRGEGFETIFGYNLKTFEGNAGNWDNLIHPEDKEKVLTKFNAVIDSEAHQWKDEYRFLKADGSYADVIDKAIVIKDETGKSIRMIGAMQDITMQKQEELQLKLFESVVKNINDVVLITEAEPFSAPDGPKILFVNDAFTTATGYTKEEAIGKTPRILQGPKTDRKELDKLNAAFKKWEPIDVELVNYKKNGEEFWVNLSIVPLTNEKGWYTHWLTVQKDITVKKRAEQELKVFYEIGAFINTNNSFDVVLKNVITSIATYLQFDSAEAWSVNFDNSKMVYRAKYENSEFETDWSGYAEKVDFVKGQGLSGIALEQKKVVYWDDLQHSPSIRKESAAKAGLTSGMALPVLFNGEVVAVFNFYSKASFTKQQLTADILNKVSLELGAGIQKNRAEAELNSFFSLSPDMLCIIGTDGYFKKINQAFTNIIGYSEQEFLTNPKIKFVHPDDCEKTNAETKRLLNGGQPAYFENRYISKNKGIIWLAWSFTAILDEGLIFAVAKDITYKRKLEQERTRILESISDYFYALDANFNFTYINSEAKKLLQPYEDSLLGKNIWEVFPLLKESDFYLNAVKAVQHTEPIHFEFYETIADVWYEESFYPTEEGLSVFFRSVNDRKQSEAKLTELNKVLAKNAAEMAASNSELERFAYVASHDLQEPLRMVSGFMQLLLKKYEPVLDENGKKYINFAIDGAARMKTLIHDLLHYSRAGAGALVLEPVDMNEVMADVKMILKASMGAADATLIIEDLPIITANILMVTQLMQNLIGNAIKYREANTKPVINIACSLQDNEWIFAIKDNGIGIPEGYEEKIFEVFHRLHTKQEYTGTGIGLSICKKIVEKLDGKIWVEPNIGGGSIFKFTIPA
jgi:PAS domain S-box-containing protein